jgi:hypothetical protein
MLVDGVEYECFVASDCNRDSMQWEWYSGTGAERTLLFEIVRFDGRKEWAFVQHVESLPLALVEYAALHARTKLGPFFDG